MLRGMNFKRGSNKSNLRFFRPIWSQKKGVSAVVATVLIVMITVAAVGLLWAIVAPFLKTNVADKANCVEAEMSIEVDYGSKYSCVSVNNGTSVRVSLG